MATKSAAKAEQSSQRRGQGDRAAPPPRGHSTRSIGILIAQIGAAASASGAILGLVFLLAPGLKLPVPTGQA